MFDTSPDGLLRLIKQGESQTVEFQLLVPPSEIIARNFAAFANSEGGILLLGVGDDGSIIGLTDREANEAMVLLQHVADSLLSWPIGIGTTLVEAKKVVYAIIDKAPEHLAPIVTARGEVFTRVGQQTRPMPLSEYVRTTSSPPRSI